MCTVTLVDLDKKYPQMYFTMCLFLHLLIVEGHLQDTDCKCETLPDGEKICDPYGCEEGNVNLCSNDNSCILLSVTTTCIPFQFYGYCS